MTIDKHIDVTGSCCPVPLIELCNAVKTMSPGQCLEIIGDDPIFVRSVDDYCMAHGYTILERQADGRRVTFTVQI